MITINRKAIAATGTTTENEPIIKSDGASSNVMQWLSNNEASNITISEDGSNNLDLVVSAGNVGIGGTATDKLTLVDGQMRLTDSYGIRWGTNAAGIYGSAAGYGLKLYTAGVERMNINNAGLSSFSAGIAFSSQTESTTGTPAASSVLSHYETGTWTATDDSGAGLTLAVSDFSYTRIGDRVFVSGYFAYPTTSDTTNAKIGGLPFNVANDNDARGLTVSWADATTLAYTLPIDNQDQFRLYDSSGNALTNATLTSRTIYISGVYRV
jgi:hypothetical protein